MNKAEREQQIHEREVIVSRAKLVLIVLCCIAIPVTFWVNHRDVGHVNNRVTKIESPCLKYAEEKTRENKEHCEESFEKAVLTITHPEACAILRKAGLEIKECAGARLKQEAGRRSDRRHTAEGGGASQPGSTGTQQPGPHPGGHTEGGTTPHHEGVSPEEGPKSSPEANTPPSQPTAQAPETPAPAPEPSQPTAKAPIKEAVGETVGTVKEVLCTTADRLAGLCH